MMTERSHRSMLIFGASSAAAFWVNAIGHAWMLWRGNPLVRQHKATLKYRSALVGDSTLLPLVNVILDRQLEAWGDGLRRGHIRRGRLARAACVGAALTALFHAYQAGRHLNNWTMPRPWRWNALGYYHALYMAGQFTLLAYFCGAAATRARDAGAGVLVTRRLVTAAGMLIAFAVLLYKDYY